MPAKSKAQQRFMGIMYSDPQKRKEAGITKKVAKDFASTSHDNLPEKVKESMNFTEFCEFISETEEPMYQVEGELPQCPPGYIYNREKMDCVPKTRKDGVKGRLRDSDKKDLKPGNTSFNVWGRTGINGDGYAWEDGSNLEGGSNEMTPEPR